MSKTRWFTRSLICALAAAPSIAQAQTADSTKQQTAEDLIHQLVRGLVGPNWNLFLHGGPTVSQRYLLEQAVDPIAGKRSLQSAVGYAIGGGVGVDALLHVGLRASYTFTSSNMNFRTDNGNGSSALNIDDVARLKSSVLALEAMRYMLLPRARVSPYGSLGVQATWWSLDAKSPLVTSANAGTPFSIDPLFTFGVQVKATNHWGGRLEAVMARSNNPFSGGRSFQSFAGPTIDEPTSVNQTSFRLAGVYHFGRPKVTIPPPTMAQH